MTLILESAIRAFDLEEGRLCRPAPGGLDTGSPVDFSLETIYTYASHYDSLRPDEHPDWVCIPLHELEGPALTDEYVAYTDHDVHGEIFIYQNEDGQDFVDAETFVETPLVRRLRFWHPDYLDSARESRPSRE